MGTVGTGIALISAVDTILRMGDQYYGARADWKQIASQMQLLKTTYETWKAMMEDYGLDISPGSIISKLLETVKAEAERVELKWSKSQREGVLGRMTRISTMMKGTLFPASRLGERLKDLQNDLNKSINEILEQPGMTQRRARDLLGKKFNLDFTTDDRYVRLMTMEKLVMTELKKQGRVVVLLYGGVGTGKSALVRQLALVISKFCKERNYSESRSTSIVTRTGRASTSREESSRLRGTTSGEEIQLYSGPSSDVCDVPGNTTEGNIDIDYVLYYDARNPGCDLVQDLRVDLAGAYEQGEGTSDPSANNIYFVKKNKDILRGVLKERKVLIIVDNLDDQNLVAVMDLFSVTGENVKILLTSRSSNVDLSHVPGVSLKRIRMEKMTQGDAKKVLQSHIYVSGKKWTKSEDYALPNRDLDMKKIMESVDVNPWAMACIAASVDKDQCSNLKEWTDAARGVSKLLGKSGQPVLIHGYQEAARHSFWSAMEEEYGRAQTGQDLLLLICTFQKSSTPFHRRLIEVFWRAVFEREEFNGLDDSVKVLEDRQFINHQGAEQPQIYTIYLLVRLFIDEKKAGEKERMFSKCRSDQEASAIVELKTEIERCNASVDNDEFHIGEESTHFLAHLALGNDHEKRRILNHTVDALIRALDNDTVNFSGVRENAALALANLASGDVDNRFRIIQAYRGTTPGYTAHLFTRAMDSHGNDRSNLRWHAARALANLVDGDGPDADRNKMVAVGSPPSRQTLELLVKAIAKNDDLSDAGHGLRTESARALAGLAEGVELIALRIKNLQVRVHQGNAQFAINHLAQVLTESGNYNLRTQVARIFSSLASAGDDMRRRILDCADSLKAFVELVLLQKRRSYDGNQEAQLQIQGARALYCLTEGEGDIKPRILEYVVRKPQMLSKLFRVLSIDADWISDYELCKHVARTLRNLSNAADDDIKRCLRRTPDAVHHLSGAIVYHKDHLDLQVEAAKIFKNLVSFSSGDREGKLEFVDNHSGEVLCLIYECAKDSNDPTLTNICTKALENLVDEGWQHGMRYEINRRFGSQIVKKVIQLLPHLDLD